MTIQSGDLEGLANLIEFDEPEALLERLKRLADQRARQLKRGLLSDELAANRWRKLVEAINRVQTELDQPAKTTAQEIQPTAPAEPTSEPDAA